MLLVTIFAGTWFDLDGIGGPLQAVENLLPFTHALEAMRAVLADGAGYGAVATDISWVLAYSVAAVVAAGLSFKRRMLE